MVEPHCEAISIRLADCSRRQLTGMIFHATDLGRYFSVEDDTVMANPKVKQPNCAVNMEKNMFAWCEINDAEDQASGAADAYRGRMVPMCCTSLNI